MNQDQIEDSVLENQVAFPEATLAEIPGAIRGVIQEAILPAAQGIIGRLEESSPEECSPTVFISQPSMS